MRCWGALDDLNIGDDEPASAGADVPLDAPVNAVVMSYDAMCVLLEGGAIACAGDGHQGALGYGDAQFRPFPPNGTVTLDHPLLEVGMQSGTTCALLDTRDVRCWGSMSGGLGGLGVGEFCGTGCEGPNCCIGDDEPPLDWPPVQIGAPVLHVDVGDSSALVLTTDGRVRTWGYSIFGALGLGPDYADSDLGDDESPIVAPDVDLGGVAVQVSAGLPSCALLDDGTVRCWGSPTPGYGIGPVGDDEVPAEVGPVPLPRKVVGIDAGTSGACAILDDGALYCWGDNLSSALGLGHDDPIGDDETPLDAGPVDVGGPVREVSVGTQHICAVLEDGTLRCWGRNDRGQLGYGHTETIGDDETPASAGPVPWK
jgi:alpha-tubulin suppressor-like RCC1 family protein